MKNENVEHVQYLKYNIKKHEEEREQAIKDQEEYDHHIACHQIRICENIIKTIEASDKASNCILDDVSNIEDSQRELLLKFLNWYVKDEALRDKQERLTSIVDRYLKGF